MQSKIKYLKHNEINKLRWDECIENSPNGLIYSYSWYLDVVAPSWEALVFDDYEAVMPLPVRRKYGIEYVYVPYFAQQLGIIGKADKSLVQDFFKSVPSNFKLIDINLNEDNEVLEKTKRTNSNFKLKLNQPYEQIKANYNRNCSRNIKKAQNAGFIFQQSISAKEFVGFVKDNLSEQLDGDRKDAFKILEKLIDTSIKRNFGELACLKSESDDLHAAGFYLFDKTRLIFSVCASSKFGKENHAMYLLVDSQIRKYAGKFDWYDFSGSNMKGIAYFNSTFGAKISNYQTISINRLPLWIRWLKR